MAFMTFTKSVLKNFFSAPATTKYPAVPKEYPERTRGHIEIDIEKCIFCGMCMRSCPPGCITVVRNDAKWSINRFDCIQCGYCTEKCPKKCLSLVPGYQTPGQQKMIADYVRPGGVPVPVKPEMRPATKKVEVSKRTEEATESAREAAVAIQMSQDKIMELRAANKAKREAAEAAKEAEAIQAAEAEKAAAEKAAAEAQAAAEKAKTEAAAPKPAAPAKPKLTPEQIAELRAANLAKRAAAQAAKEAEEAKKEQ